MLRFGEPVVQVSQIGVEIAHGLLLCKHLPEIHADPDVLRRKLIGVEPLSIERDQAIVAIEHAQPLRQVSQRVLEFAHGVAQFALCAVERLLSSPVERGRRQDDEGEQQRSAEIDFLAGLSARIDLLLRNAGCKDQRKSARSARRDQPVAPVRATFAPAPIPVLAIGAVP